MTRATLELYTRRRRKFRAAAIAGQFASILSRSSRSKSELLKSPKASPGFVRFLATAWREKSSKRRLHATDDPVPAEEQRSVERDNAVRHSKAEAAAMALLQEIDESERKDRRGDDDQRPLPIPAVARLRDGEAHFPISKPTLQYSYSDFPR